MKKSLPKRFEFDKVNLIFSFSAYDANGFKKKLGFQIVRMEKTATNSYHCPWYYIIWSVRTVCFTLETQWKQTGAG